ncbi:MAG TPA: carboxypeptidase-like regulatory domain-containing protein [Saprospiraceae bacterium]|nr:carboxypeptidase-like regulatory domain-containing protein [Saprospiraceae bacterium]
MCFSLFILLTAGLTAQTTTLRGHVFDEATGEAVSFSNVNLTGTDFRAVTDLDGFFNFTNLPAGTYELQATFIGFDTLKTSVTLVAGQVKYLKVYMKEAIIELRTINVNASLEQRRNEVNFSKITVTPKQIKALPSAGGEADIAQYIQVLPGVISTGDQGGQIYIRGGSPVQNKVLLDGMTIYNPFHSIGFFSVFETEAIKSAEVLTGGFGAEYGGRISAIVDLKTRDGDKTRFGGLVSASPFQVKGLLEGPIIPFDTKKESSASFLLTGKHSYLDETSPKLYDYATKDTLGLPYSYTDFYGKMSFQTGGGSKIDFFGFNFTDGVNLQDVAKLDWNSGGGGMNFKLIPSTSNLLISGTVAYSKYNIALKEADEAPRKNSIGGFNAVLDFTYYGKKSQVNYGFDLNGFSTDFAFRNFVGITFEQNENTTELGGYVTFRHKAGAVIIEPGLRTQFYASLGNFSLEPRLAVKSNFSDHFRMKFAFGRYSQNLISTVNERDVVNLFVGFLSGPEERIYKPNTRIPTADKLQKAYHVLGGFEFDLNSGWEINCEGYYKGFTQLIGISRNKLSEEDPDFATETGNAYGLDLTFSRQTKKVYFWATYSLGYVKRDDGEQVYPAHFERRHNINILTSIEIGRTWEFSVRWNYGSGFPFTLTQGFYGNYNLLGGIDSDVLTGNPDLGTIYSDKRNSGHLPDYHRLDVSLKKTFEIKKNLDFELLLSITNVYDRKNIFYFDRIRYTRVDQLPILPSLTAKFDF